MNVEVGTSRFCKIRQCFLAWTTRKLYHCPQKSSSVEGSDPAFEVVVIKVYMFLAGESVV